MTRHLYLIAFACLLASASSVLAAGSQDQGGLWSAPLDWRAHAADPQGHAQAARTAARDAQRAAWRARALAARGYVGSQAYLQGCDLVDIDSDRQDQIARAMAESNTAALFANLRLAVVEDAPDLPALDATGDLDRQVATRYARDQAVRAHLNTPAGDLDEPVLEAVLNERFNRACEIDLENGEWLRSVDLAGVLFGATSPATRGAIVALALHADHLPALQDEVAQALFVRSLVHDEGVEPALRLKDRSLINLGRPQIYGTGIICDNGQPIFAGDADLARVNAARAALGLELVDFQQMRDRRFCR